MDKLDKEHSFCTLNISRMSHLNYIKPIAFTTPSHLNLRKKISFLKVASRTNTSSAKQKGIVVEWRQKKTSFIEKDLSFVVWIIAHAMFWLHVTHILPSGAGLELKQPPWHYKAPLPKPDNRDYIIEPDWESHYL